MKLTAWGGTTPVTQRLILAAFTAVVLVSLAFAGVVIFDRYVHFGDRSPGEVRIGQLESLARQHPQDASARLTLAEAYLDAGQHASAIQQARQVIAAYPLNDAAHYLLGLAQLRAGQPQAAQDALDTFITMRGQSALAGLDPLLQAAYYYNAQASLDLNQPEAAVRLLQSALALNRTDADALFLLGSAYLELDQAQPAIEPCLAAARLVPDFTEAYACLEQAYRATGQLTHANFAAGMRSYAAEQPEAALPLLEAAAAALPEFLPAQLGLGLVYEQLGQPELARQCYTRALQLDPQDFTAGQALSRLDQHPAEH